MVGIRKVGINTQMFGMGGAGDVIAPILASVEVGDVADDEIVLTYDETLDDSTPATGDYSVAGTVETISSVTVNGLTVTLAMSGVIYDFQTITISYTAGANPIRDAALNESANLTNEAVTNNSSISHPTVLDSANTLAFFKNELAYITKDGSDFVSQWDDISGEDNHLLQAVGADQPLWQSTGVLFDGIDHFMKCSAFTFEQPEQIYIVLKQITWASNKFLHDGNTLNSGILRQLTSTPNLGAYAGSVSSLNGNLAVGSFGIVRLLFNGASSELIVNVTTPITGDFGSGDMSGFTLAGTGTGDAGANIEVKEVILRNIADTAPNEQIIYDYLSNKYGI